MVTTRRLQDPERHPRLHREYRTLRAMTGIYCHDIHGEDQGPCEECRELLEYATRRLDRCVFGDDKPTCANCKVHCYNAAMRAKVREAMRYAGPRMLWRHPVLAIRHLLDGRRAPPDLPAKQATPADRLREQRDVPGSPAANAGVPSTPST